MLGKLRAAGKNAMFAAAAEGQNRRKRFEEAEESAAKESEQRQLSTKQRLGELTDFLEATLYDRDNAVIQARRAESQPRASREPAQMLRS